MEAFQLYELAKQDYNDLEIFLADQPQTMTAKDENQRLLLHWAALNAREKLVKYLIENKNASNVNTPDDRNGTPLILATLGGCLGTVKYLLSKGADINAQNSDGHSSLQYACSKGRQEIVAYLLEKGADINIRDNRNDTCLHRLATTGRDEIMKILLNHSQKPDLNAQNKEGNTPLHIACEDEQLPCAILLIENGASTTVLNKDKQSPLDLCKPTIFKQIKTKFNFE